MLRIAVSCMLILTLFSCREDSSVPCTDPADPDCPNYNPCLVVTPANAEFVMIDSFENFQCSGFAGKGYYLAEADTVISGSRIYLSALHEHDSYRWSIGSDTSYPRAKSFAFDLPENFPSDTVRIQLIVSRLDPDNCGIQKVDTLTRTLHIIDVDLFGGSWSLVVGSFKGADTDAPLDSFTITIPPIFPTFQGIDNFPKGCTAQYHDVSTYRHGLILNTPSTAEPCNDFCGVGMIQEDRRTLVIDYSIREGNGRRQKRWIGKRIN